MSETLSHYPSQAEELIDQVDRFTNEITQEAFPKLDGQLMPLVAANSDVIVICPWMSGAEVPLGIAMINYPSLMSEESADSIIAGVYDLLANRVLPKDETDGSEVLEEQAEEEPAMDTKQIEPMIKEPPQKQSGELKKQNQKNIIKDNNHKQPSKLLAVKSNHQPIKVNAKPDQLKTIPIKTGATKLAASEPRLPKIGRSIEPISSVSKDVLVVPVGSTEVVQTSASEPTTRGETVNNLASSEARQVSNQTKLVDPESSGFEQASVLTNREKPFVEKNEPAAIEKTTEATNYQRDTSESVLIPDQIRLVEEQAVDPIEIEDVMVAPEMEVPLETASYQLEVDEPLESMFVLNHVEEGVQTVQVEPIVLSDEVYLPSSEIIEDDFEVEPVLQPSLKAKIVEPTEERAEQASRINPRIQEIEDSLVQLAEIIETSQPEVTEEVSRILNQIADVPKNLEEFDRGEMETDHDVETIIKAELEELFTELFTLLNIECTPEIIETLIVLTINYRSVDSANKLVDREEPDQSISDIGTHEVIDLLLQSSNTNRKMFTEANLIGSFAIRLYASNTFDFAAEYEKRYGLPQAA